MNSDSKTIKTIFLGFLVVTFAGVANLATGLFPLTQSANANDIDLADFKCFGMFNSCDNNIDNNVTDNSDNSQDNDVNITDSFNPTQVCGNNVESTSQGSNTTCVIGIGAPDIAPSTIGLS
ncbi:hypothetical protein [Candidatus Nitrosocosmicus arcticus]|nr:hypothetical protein [Candidatus Nitrosocosmicus arcticus]